MNKTSVRKQIWSALGSGILVVAVGIGTATWVAPTFTKALNRYSEPTALDTTRSATQAGASSSLPATRIKVPGETRQMICPALNGTAAKTTLWAVGEAETPSATYLQGQEKSAPWSPLPQRAETSHRYSQLSVNNAQGGNVLVQTPNHQAAQTVGLVSSLGQDKQSGVLVDTCRFAQTEAYYLVGSTQVGNQADLFLVNPGSTEKEVTLQGWSNQGGLGEKTVKIGPSQRTKISLAAQFGSVERLGLKVSAPGQGVVSFLTTSIVQGATPQGAAVRIPLAQPQTTGYLPAVWLTETSELQVLNPGKQQAQFQVTVLGGEKPIRLGQKTLRVEGGAITRIPVHQKSTGWQVLKITANAPVTAQVFDRAKLSNGQPGLVNYPSLELMESGIITPDRAGQKVVLTAAQNTQVRLRSAAGERQTLTLAADSPQTLALKPGLWEWESDRPLALGWVVSGVDPQITPVVGATAGLEQASSIRVSVRP